MAFQELPFSQTIKSHNQYCCVYVDHAAVSSLFRIIDTWLVHINILNYTYINTLQAYS